MNRILQLKIGGRLALAFASVLTLTAVMLLVSIFQFNELGKASARLVSEDWTKSKSAAVVNALTRANARRTMELFFASDESQTSKLHAQIQRNKNEISAALNTFEQLTRTDEGKNLLARVTDARIAYVQSFSKVDKLLQSGQRDEALITLKAETLPKLDLLEERISVLSEHEQARVEAAGVKMEANVVAVRELIVGLGLSALAIGAVLAWWLTRSITRPLARAVTIAETVAAGDLTSRIDIDSMDEAGQLLAALKKMNESLVHIVGQVRTTSDSIATGSSQIAMGNADLSQRTEEQASNLQQTAASMEQMTASVKQNSDTAREAAQVASGATQAATDGGQVVQEVVRTMSEISEASRKIGDIIGTIDGIAFQTNILALNAAVEAARAGEQGRGFAVVASEVRTLAQRSAEAAKEIKSLIGASVERVEHGNRLVGEAGKSMAGIVTEVQRVNDLISAISAASIEQSTGIGQVGGAVAQLDHVTQQNAALVEESAAAAESLKSQAANLAQTVAVFRI